MNINKMNNWKLGSSVGMDGQNNTFILKSLADAKIKYMELSTDYDTYFNEDKLDFINKSADIKAEADKFGVELWSIHLPFSGNLDISLADERSDKTMRAHLDLITAAAKADFKVAVVHPSSEPIADDDRPARLEKSRTNLKILAEHAKSHGLKLAVEDLPRTCLGNCSDDMLYLLRDNPDLNICFDTNHLLKQDNTEFINIVGDKIITLHVSDYDFIDERHQLPFMGKNNWKSVITALENAGYNGPWMYEVSRSKFNLSFDDLYNNYIQLGEL